MNQVKSLNPTNQGSDDDDAENYLKALKGHAQPVRLRGILHSLKNPSALDDAFEVSGAEWARVG